MKFNINYDILAIRNYEDLFLENFRRFINKSITIIAKDRGNNDVFVATDVAVEYIWNSSQLMGLIYLVMFRPLVENFISSLILI